MERKICTMCSVCRERTVALAVVPYEIQADHDGRKHQVYVPDLSVAKCTKCGEMYFDDFASEQVSRALRAQAGLLQPETIRQEREKLGLSQQEVADMLGVSMFFYEGWESGHIIQSRLHDRFLRVFFLLPELRHHLARLGTLEKSDSDGREPEGKKLVATVEQAVA